MSCQKVRYPTRSAAIRAALGSSKTFATGVRIYPCQECKALHLTTKSKRPRRNR